VTARTFTGYRPAPPAEYAGKGITNAGVTADYEGALFTDGTVVVRWLTAYRSHSVWACWADFYQVHGHPEYGTVITWDDGGDETGPPRGMYEGPPCPEGGVHHNAHTWETRFPDGGTAAVQCAGWPPVAVVPCTAPRSRPAHAPHDYKILTVSYHCPGHGGGDSA